MVWLSDNETIDRNYWSDYSLKYPNAAEVDSSGIGSLPYVYHQAQVQSDVTFQDNNPLMNPDSIPLTNSSTILSPSPTLIPTASIQELPYCKPLIVVIFGTINVIALISKKRGQPFTSPKTASTRF